MKNEINMTTGRPMSLMIKFALPVLGGGILQQAYSMADAVIAGRFIGSFALAAISNSFYINLIVTILFTGIASGASVVVSQIFGAGDTARVRRTVDTIAVTIFTAGIISSAVGIAAAPYLIKLLSSPDELVQPTMHYLTVMFSGCAASFGYYMTSALLNAVGNSRTPLVMLGASSLVNVALDCIFVALFHMGISSLALATVISQVLSLVGCIWYINGSGSVISYRIRGIVFDAGIFKKIMRLGLPTGVQDTLMIISMAVIQKSINGFGVAVVAGRGIESHVEMSMLIFLSAIQTTVMTFTGQNTGAGSESRAREGVRCGCIMSCVVTVFFYIIMLLWTEPIMRIFANDTHAVQAAVRCMDIVIRFYITYSLAIVFQAFFRGIGNTEFPLIVALATQFVFRIAFVRFYVDYFKSPDGIWYLYVSSWVLMLAMYVAYYKSGCWKKFIKR